jgi:hypothetical protein
MNVLQTSILIFKIMEFDFLIYFLLPPNQVQFLIFQKLCELNV